VFEVGKDRTGGKRISRAGVRYEIGVTVLGKLVREGGREAFLVFEADLRLDPYGARVFGWTSEDWRSYAKEGSLGAEDGETGRSLVQAVQGGSGRIWPFQSPKRG